MVRSFASPAESSSPPPKDRTDAPEQPGCRDPGHSAGRQDHACSPDCGILHHFLNTPTLSELERLSNVGASWEGFTIETLIRQLHVDTRSCYFWRTHRGFEIKRTTAPTVTPSMRRAIEDLALDRIDVLHAGDETFTLAPKIGAIAARDLLDELESQR